jgi:hypothetical protein
VKKSEMAARGHRLLRVAAFNVKGVARDSYIYNKGIYKIVNIYAMCC